MSTQFTIKQQWTVSENPFILEYEMVYSINPEFEDFELWEYGIRCKLFDETHTLLSEAEVIHISPKESFVTSLVNTMCQYKVFPVHILDVVYDELAKDLE